MKRYTSYALFSLVGFLATMIHSSVATVAIIDLSVILKSSATFKATEATLKQKVSEMEKGLMAAKDQFDKEANQMQSLQSQIPAPEFQKRKDKLEAKANDINNNSVTEKRKIEEAYNNAVLALQEKVQNILNELAKVEKFTMVFDKSFILWSGPEAVDLTDKVVSALQKLEKTASSAIFPGNSKPVQVPASMPAAVPLNKQQ